MKARRGVRDLGFLTLALLLGCVVPFAVAVEPADAVTTMAEFPVPTTGGAPHGIAAGPDGNVWFTEYAADKIGKITPSGVITEYPLPTTNSGPESITAGPDGNLWFTEFAGDKIGMITPSGTVSEYPLPGAGSGPESIIAGPDGNLWFTELLADRIGQITPTGAVTDFNTNDGGGGPDGITVGPDGNLWFTETKAGRIGLLLGTHVSQEWQVASFGSTGYSRIATGPDGTLWATWGEGRILRFAVNGGVLVNVGSFLTGPAGGGPQAMTTGPDGNAWITDAQGVERITPNGNYDGFPFPAADSGTWDITTGPDGNLWFTESDSNKIGRITLASVSVSATSVDFATQAVGSASSARTLTVTNSGDVPLHLGDLATSGQNAADFVLGNDLCSGATIQPGSTCTLQVVFSPTAPGARSASLAIPSDAPQTPPSVSLTGTGQAPPAAATVSPASLSFGTAQVGSATVPQTVTVTNTGGSTLNIASLSIDGTNSADFAVTNNGCTAAIQPAGNCTIDVRFTPTASGTRSASLQIPSNAPSTPNSVPLTGTGTTGADVSVAINGPSSAASGSNDTYAVTVSNAGPSTAANVVMSAQVPNGTKFVSVQTTHGSCTHPASGATSGTITCSLGDFTSGSASISSVSLKITLKSKGGNILVVAKAYSVATGTTPATPDPAQANNVASFSTTITK